MVFIKTNYVFLSLIFIIFFIIIDFFPHSPTSRDIWSKFLSFESQVGDLASIIKVEKRRMSTMEKVGVLVMLVLSKLNIDIEIMYVFQKRKYFSSLLLLSLPQYYIGFKL